MLATLSDTHYIRVVVVDLLGRYPFRPHSRFCCLLSSPAALQGEGGLPRGAAAPAVLCRPQCPLWHPSKATSAHAPAWKGGASTAAAVASGASAATAEHPAAAGKAAVHGVAAAAVAAAAAAAPLLLLLLLWLTGQPLPSAAVLVTALAATTARLGFAGRALTPRQSSLIAVQPD